jgi:hypothetical protein
MEYLNLELTKTVLILITQLFIRSRHIGAKKYNVYVKYKTEVNSLDGIESRYCTCKAGMRTVGCCSHVASIIYFLSYGKYLDHIPNPSSKLTSIFPISNYKICNKNKSKAIKKETKKVKKYELNTLTLSDNDSVDCLSEFDDSDECFIDSGIPNDYLSTIASKNDLKNHFDDSCNNDLNELNSSMKRLLSNDVDELIPNKRSTRSQNKHNDIGLNINDFKLRIPNWGGQLVNEKNNQLGFNITNTCTIDYFLLSLWASSRLRTKIIDIINPSTFTQKQDFINIINSIEFIQWNKAKST